MATTTLERTETTTPETEGSATPSTTRRPSRFVLAVAIMAIVVGAGSVLGGIAGAVYTYDQAAVQGITTPEDARLAEVPVRGPLSMWAQSDIITHHQLDRTDGLYYAQMERMVPQVDESGEIVVDEAGDVVMVPNEARLSWIDATALTTSLGLGILAYALSAFAVAVGAVLIAVGLVLRRLRYAELA